MLMLLLQNALSRTKYVSHSLGKAVSRHDSETQRKTCGIQSLTEIANRITLI